MIDRRAIDQVAAIGIAISLIVFGAVLIFDPTFTSSFGYQIHFGEYHYLFGLALIAVGVFILYPAIARKKRSE